MIPPLTLSSGPLNINLDTSIGANLRSSRSQKSLSNASFKIAVGSANPPSSRDGRDKVSLMLPPLGRSAGTGGGSLSIDSQVNQNNNQERLNKLSNRLISL